MHLSLNRHIETTPGVRSGKPCIAGTRITVADIAIKHLDCGQSLEEIARTFHLPLAAAYAGMAYYFDHRAEIDERTATGEALAEEMRKNSLPSPLQAKLDAMRRE